MKALAAARRSCFLPFRFSMMLLPWTQAVVLSISATGAVSALETEKGRTCRTALRGTQALRRRGQEPWGRPRKPQEGPQTTSNWLNPVGPQNHDTQS